MNEDAVVLISEMECIGLPSEYLPLLTQLQSPTEIDEISMCDVQYLEHLSKLGLVVNANLNDLPNAVASYWLAKQYSPRFAAAQLKLSIRFIGPHSARYRAMFSARYPECNVVDDDARLLVYVTDNLLDCDMPGDLKAPVLLIKIGGIKQSIGPVLSPVFKLTDLQQRISRPFDADLSVRVPEGIQATADNILLSELYHLRVQAGSHMASDHVVEWDMSQLTKQCWKVKF